MTKRLQDETRVASKRIQLLLTSGVAALVRLDLTSAGAQDANMPCWDRGNHGANCNVWSDSELRTNLLDTQLTKTIQTCFGDCEQGMFETGLFQEPTLWLMLLDHCEAHVACNS